MYTITITGSIDGDNTSYEVYDPFLAANNFFVGEVEDRGMDIWMDGGKAWFEFVAFVEAGEPAEYDHGDGIKFYFE